MKGKKETTVESRLKSSCVMQEGVKGLRTRTKPSRYLRTVYTYAELRLRGRRGETQIIPESVAGREIESEQRAQMVRTPQVLAGV